MNGNREQRLSETFSGATETVDWRLRNWVSSKEVHVSTSSCEVSLPMRYETAQLRYGLNWVKQKHGAAEGMYVTRYLGLYVEPWRLPRSGPLFLKVKLSWNQDKSKGSVHPSTFETCVCAQECGKKVTVFEKILPDATDYVRRNGECENYGPNRPLPEGNDLILSITTTVVTSNSSNCAA